MRRSVSILLTLEMMVGCGMSTTIEPTGCVAGMSVGCVCSDGQMGAQTCTPDETYGVCVCSGDADAGVENDSGGLLIDGGDADWDAGGESGDSGMDASVPADDGGTSPTAIVAVEIGDYHGCVVRGDGTVWCWGRNQYGQLGNGATVDSTFPVQARDIMNAVRVVVGYAHSCALLADATVSCWGYNFNHELGFVSLEPFYESVPMPLPALTGVAELAAAGHSTCARGSDDRVRCWGDNAMGQLGDGTTMRRSAPTEVVGLPGATAITMSDTATCALRGTVPYCWGANDSGELGIGTIGGMRNAPTSPVMGVTDALAIAAGGSGSRGSACVVRSSEAIACWGNNDYGQIGITDRTSRSAAVDLPDTANVSEVRVALFNGAALDTSGSLTVWGDNSRGSLGDGTLLEAPAPVAPMFPGPVTALSAALLHFCAISDGALYCWGANETGQCGITPHTDVLSPTRVPGL